MLATISTARMLLAASHPHSVGGGGGVVATTLSACLSSLLHQHQHHQPPQQQQQHAALLSSTSAAAAVSQPHPPAAGGHSQQQTDTAEASSTSSSGAGRDDDTIDFGKFKSATRNEQWAKQQLASLTTTPPLKVSPTQPNRPLNPIRLPHRGTAGEGVSGRARVQQCCQQLRHHERPHERRAAPPLEGQVGGG